MQCVTYEDCQPCIWCGEVETKLHRFVQCPAFQVVRDRHPFALEVLHVHRPEWVYAPFATTPDAHDVLALLFASRPPPSWPTNVEQLLGPQPALPLRFYTDGTCMYPAEPRARHAAWAVVYDSHHGPEERAGAESRWVQHRVLPPTFLVASQGVVPGRQSVPRAELCAAIQAVRIAYAAGKAPCLIVTVCAYVVHVFRRFSSGLGFATELQSANLDLLLLLREVWYDGVAVRKVRSHQLQLTPVDSPELWHRIGNHVADQACGRALQMDLPVISEMTASVVEFLEQQQDMLCAVFRYLVELDEVTQQMLPGFTTKDATRKPSAHAVDRYVPEAARDAWIRDHTRTWVGMPPPPPGAAVFRSCKWGEPFAASVWLRLCSGSLSRDRPWLREPPRWSF